MVFFVESGDTGALVEKLVILAIHPLFCQLLEERSREIVKMN